jgi:FkbM family methyltransferase
MRLSRWFLNTINRGLGILGVRLCSKSEFDFLEFRPDAEEAIRRSEAIGARGADCAFFEYLQFRDAFLDRVGGATGLLSDYLEDPSVIAVLARETAGKYDDPIDHFISFYATVAESSRSQWSQDVFVWYISGGRRDGRYLEIGGADGVTHSNTLALRDCLGWTGALIEPHPIVFQNLKRFRGRTDRVINAAAGPLEGSEHAILIDAGQLSCIAERLGDDIHYSTRIAAAAQFEVEQIPFSKILQDVGPLDYLSLDVEGSELEMLNWVEWNKIEAPEIITIEHNWRASDQIAIRKFLAEKGYIECFSEFPWLTRGDYWFYLSGCDHVGLGPLNR